MVKRGSPTPLSFRMSVLAQGRGLVSEEADHARRLISAKRHDPRLAFTTLLLELLRGAGCCWFLCLAFSRSTTAFPLFCFCPTGIQLALRVSSFSTCFSSG